MIDVTLNTVPPRICPLESEFPETSTIADVLREFDLDRYNGMIVANGGLAFPNDRLAQFDQHSEGRVFIALA